LIGLLAGGETPPAEIASSSPEAERDLVRTKHGVRLVRGSEEGSPTRDLPGGVYGFTYAPAQDLRPAFSQHSRHSFELHKLADGSERLIGFVSPSDALAFQEGSTGIEIVLYPDPCNEARVLVSLPLDRVAPSAKGPSRSDGNALRVRI
jgi:hypothetical protein